MIVALCVENRMGLQFAGRRLSKDAQLRRMLLERSGGKLRMSPYSAKQFESPVYAGADYLTGASEGEWCFVENDEYLSCAGQIERIVLFHWNRDYPADLFFSFPGQWHLTGTEDFPGKSHEKITMEVYER